MSVRIKSPTLGFLYFWYLVLVLEFVGTSPRVVGGEDDAAVGEFGHRSTGEALSVDTRLRRLGPWGAPASGSAATDQRHDSCACVRPAYRENLLLLCAGE